jgi:predicted RNA-binding Zn ribbon-like protein
MSDNSPFRSGAGSLCLDLIRTLRYRGRASEYDEISTVDRWDAWVRHFGLDYQPDPDPDRARRARELREHIATMLTAATDRGLKSVGRTGLDALNAAASYPVPAPRLTTTGTLHRVSDHPGRALRSVLAREALELIATADMTRLRRCANPDCRTLFLDASRPGTRRWCAMSGCGDRAKKAEQRARDRTQQRSPEGHA